MMKSEFTEKELMALRSGLRRELKHLDSLYHSQLFSGIKTSYTQERIQIVNNLLKRKL